MTLKRVYHEAAVYTFYENHR